MKKTAIVFAAIIAAASLASCQKEEMVYEQNAQKEIIPEQSAPAEISYFTAAIIAGFDTKADISNGSADRLFKWEVNDEISVSDGRNTATYRIEADGDINAEGDATFTFKEGTRLSGDVSSYTATYGKAMAAAHIYTAAEGKLPMSGRSVNGDRTQLVFTVNCGFLKLDLTACSDDVSISRIDLVGTLADGSEATYTISCDAEAAGDIIALPAGNYTNVRLHNENGYIHDFSDIQAAGGELRSVTLTDADFDILLPGLFTVNSDGKQVRFTKGNLYHDGSAYHIEYDQTAFPTYVTSDHIGHFYWTNAGDYQNSINLPYSTDSYCVSSTETTEDSFFCGADNPLTVDGQSGLYVLTGGIDGEWNYLLGNSAERKGKCKADVKVGALPGCVVIAPDDFIGTLKDEYTLSELGTSGLVCLPPAGYRDELGLGYQSEEVMGPVGTQSARGFYQSATPDEANIYHSYRLYFDSGFIRPDDRNFRKNAYSIRLVCTVSE